MQQRLFGNSTYYTVKEGLRFSRPPAWMSLTKPSQWPGIIILLQPRRVWLVTSRLGTGKSLTFFYSLLTKKYLLLLCCTDNKILYRKFEKYIPRKGTARPQSQFLHPCFCVRFICSHGRFAYSAAENRWTDRGNI
jgi:hypothetical protein